MCSLHRWIFLFCQCFTTWKLSFAEPTVTYHEICFFPKNEEQNVDLALTFLREHDIILKIEIFEVKESRYVFQERSDNA